MDELHGVEVPSMDQGVQLLSVQVAGVHKGVQLFSSVHNSAQLLCLQCGSVYHRAKGRRMKTTINISHENRSKTLSLPAPNLTQLNYTIPNLRAAEWTTLLRAEGE